MIPARGDFLQILNDPMRVKKKAFLPFSMHIDDSSP